MDEVAAAVRASVAWLDAANGRDQASLTFRILKIIEEAGEPATAWIGFVGNNPRKGVTHTVADVAAELADVALTPLSRSKALVWTTEWSSPCVSSSDLVPLVVTNPGSSVSAELKARVIVGGMDRLVDLDAVAAELTRGLSAPGHHQRM